MLADANSLLADYARTGSEEAFAELLRRYVDLVYGAALRLLNGDSHRAEDVTQLVFIDLARSAPKVSPQVLLGGWLHRHTCFVASNIRRSEARRQTRERMAAEMISNERENDLFEIAPVLDEALNQLSSDDRHAILLRFFEQLDFRAIGAALGGSDESARKRVNRALEKLEARLRIKGVSVSTKSLVAGLTSAAIVSAPEGLVASILPLTLSGTLVTAGTTKGALMIMTGTKIAIGATGALALLGLAYSVSEHVANGRWKRENDTLREQLAAVSENNVALSNKLVEAGRNASLNRNQFQELMRLRSEAGQLKQQLASAARATNYTKVGAVNREPVSEDTVATLAIRRMVDGKMWLHALHAHDAEHPDQFVTNFDQLRPYLGRAIEAGTNPNEPQRDEAELAQTANQFELTYAGHLDAITNGNSAIIMREKEAWTNAAGAWNRTYGFADGHTEIHRSIDGLFEDWEQKHTPQLKNERE